MTLEQKYATSIDSGFRQKTEASILTTALAIVGEDWTAQGFSPAKGEKRHALGVAVLNGDVRKMQALIKVVAANIGEVANPSTIADATIDTSVASIWDDVANVKLGE